MSGRDRAERPPRTTAEWVTLGVSIVLVGLVLAVIVVAWVTGSEGPPDLVVERDGPVVVEGGRWRVPFAVHNDGDEAADQVQVVADLVIDGRVEGEGEQTFPFMSSGDTERGEFLFGKDPADGTLTLEVASWSQP
ncbi:MAG: TIGR02588 family protein [Thermoleophilia bacterium]